MVLANQSHQTLCQSDKADAEGPLVDYALDGVHGAELVGTNPQALHQQGKLLGVGGLLELESVVELLGSHLQHTVELGEEQVEIGAVVLKQFQNIPRRVAEIDDDVAPVFPFGKQLGDIALAHTARAVNEQRGLPVALLLPFQHRTVDFSFQHALLPPRILIDPIRHSIAR